jgi:two-component system, response regulator YesN
LIKYINLIFYARNKLLESNNPNEKIDQEKILKIKDLIKWLLESYYQATEIGVIFIDNKKNIFSPVPSICQLIQKSSEGKRRCLDTIHDNGLKSVEYGFPYIFQCYTGLMGWIVPFLLEGELLGYFISAGVLIKKPDFSFFKGIEKLNRTLKIKNSHMKEIIKNVKILSPEKVKAAADILHIMASYLVKVELIDVRLHQEKYIQQAKITEEIQDIKRKELEWLEKDEKDENTFISFSSLYPLETERELLKRVRLGDKKGAKEVLNEILGKILFKNDGQTELIRARLLELAVVLSRAAVEGKAELEMILGLNFEYIQEACKLKSIEELCIWIATVLDRFTESVYENRNIKNVDMIRKAREFIRANYKKKIKLIDISKAIYLSPFYLSHIFKKETGTTLLEYLEKVRIEEAKRLLENTSWNTTQISFAVGYSDQSYFCKVFKKSEGISMSEYRKRMKR